MKIVITDADTVTAGDLSFDIFREFGELTVYGLTKPEETAARIAEADIVLCNKTMLTAKNMSGAEKLRYIGLFATGYNNVDTEYTGSHGIIVCNAPGYSTEAVAQHTFALILSLFGNIGEYNETVRRGDWIKSRTFSYFPIPMTELCGKTIGIVGYGSIGRRVGDIAKAFGMKVLVCNRRRINDPSVSQVALTELLRLSDIVTLHCPLNSDSENMMNAKAFAEMKRGAVFINTARGALVDEYALRDALESGRLLGAGVDVLRTEPMTADCPLYGAKNCLITPHIAWAGYETRARLMKTVADNLRAFTAGSPINTVG